MMSNSPKPSKIPVNGSLIWPKATCVNWLPAFRPSKRTRMAKRFAGWIERPSETAIIFTLKTRGKKRGYVERQEVTGADGAELIPPRTLSPEEARQYGLKLNEEY